MMFYENTLLDRHSAPAVNVMVRSLPREKVPAFSVYHTGRLHSFRHGLYGWRAYGYHNRKALSCSVPPVSGPCILLIAPLP